MKSDFIKIAQGSDFELQDTISNINSITNFEFKYYTADINKCKIAKYDGTNYINCTKSDNGIIVYFNAPEFEAGCLRILRKYDIADESFSDGTQNIVRTDKTNIYIVNSQKGTVSSAVYSGSSITNLGSAEEIADTLSYVNTLSTDVSTLSAYLTSYALKTELPDLTSYALKTELPDLTPYAKTTYLSYFSKLSDLENVDNNTTVSIAANLIKDEIKSEDRITEVENKIPSLDGYAKTSDIPDTSSFITLSDLPDYSSTYVLQDQLPDYSNTYVLKTQLPDYSSTYQPIGDYATQEWVTAKLGDIETLLSSI